MSSKETDQAGSLDSSISTFVEEGWLNGIPYGHIQPNPEGNSYSDSSGGAEFPKRKALASGHVTNGRFLDTSHKPVLDIDFPAALVESETPGHHHLILDKQLTGHQYLLLLSVLAEVGIIEPGYLGASLERGNTVVALEPWKAKKEEG